MALKLVGGNEIRVPGGAIPVAQRRQGVLGKLDGMGWREFQDKFLYDKSILISAARAEAGNLEKAISIASKIEPIPYTGWTIDCTDYVRYRNEAWAGIALALAKEGKFKESVKMARRGASHTSTHKGQAISSIAVLMAEFGATTEQLKPIFDDAVNTASHSDAQGVLSYGHISRIAVDMATAGMFKGALETVRSIHAPEFGFLREMTLEDIVIVLAEKIVRASAGKDLEVD
ncbi:MAG: hypothetical protein NTX79_08195 [Candidatus Micrarchaeota archaeon]|nr:hypothetical protein [Candidatus Micrarchaeota archaeon]